MNHPQSGDVRREEIKASCQHYFSRLIDPERWNYLSRICLQVYQVNVGRWQPNRALSYVRLCFGSI
nr:MAG TPA_asm: outer membrane lipoprotein [Caudoviricetes sp.]